MANSADLVSKKQLLKIRNCLEVGEQRRVLMRRLIVSSVYVTNCKGSVYKGRAVNHAYYGI